MPKLKEDGSKLTDIRISVPQRTLEDLERIAADQGIAVAHLHRSCWMRGVSLTADDANKVLINRKLSAKTDLKAILESLPEDCYQEAIDMIKQHFLEGE